MSEQASYSIAIVCESDADRRTACTLSDRVLCETVDWIAPETLDLLRSYRGIQAPDPYLKWTDMKKIARKRHVAPHGFLRGKPRASDEAMAEQALLLLAALDPPPSAVVILRDTDTDSKRREGFEQARGARAWPFKVVIGVACTKRECWVLAGFEPRDDTERALLERERQDLGFDPRISAEQLTASEHGAKRDAKRVLLALTGGVREREDACLEDSPLAVLEARGKETGLAPYLREVEELLVPVFDGAARLQPASSR
jgi:hypothetical protein